MSMDGERVRIVEDPSGWFGHTLIGKTGIAKMNEEATVGDSEFYWLTNSADVPPHLLFHECRLEVVE